MIGKNGNNIRRMELAPVFSGRDRGRIRNSDSGVSVKNAIKPKTRKYKVGS